MWVDFQFEASIGKRRDAETGDKSSDCGTIPLMCENVAFFETGKV